MNTEELIAALVPLIATVTGLLLQYARSRDTNHHGDAFVEMLKGNAETFEQVAKIIPALDPYAKEYRSIVEQAERIWNSGSFTAQDIKLIEAKATLYRLHIDELLAKYRALKEVAKE